MSRNTKGKIVGVVGNLVSIDVDGPISQNEVCFIQVQDTKLMAEVIRVSEKSVYAQVYESTRGVKVGDDVNFKGHQLEVTLGPGMLGKKYDGLQNDLELNEGLLLQRGWANELIDKKMEWYFEPYVKIGDRVVAGQIIGVINEDWLKHKIMVPFEFTGTGVVDVIIESRNVESNEILAVIIDSKGDQLDLGLYMKWPIKKECCIYKQKLRPHSLLETGIRTIDIFNPMAEGGTGFIPGPFGCGKTVLLQSISRYADADIIIIIACGERANEVVDLVNEFSDLADPKTGRKLIERTIMICNTSNMPVAAREASIYTGMSIAEYFRAMGMKVLVLADSTSRWAQALREISNRMEELPGPDAYPVDLSATVSNYYSRAGIVKNYNDTIGSVTLIGSVSPPGGNFKEPVTESTQRIARCFYALSQERADRKRYPAVESIDSYSKYTEYPEIVECLKHEYSSSWPKKIQILRNLLKKGRLAWEQINILGDDNVAIDEHITFYKSELIDFILLQQDAFDKIDASTSKDRQKYMVDLILNLCDIDENFKDYEDVGHHYRKIINKLKQLNYKSYLSLDFNLIINDLEKLLNLQASI